MQDVYRIFTEAKETSAKHKKLLQKLKQLEDADNEKFYKAFVNCLRQLLNTDLKANKIEVDRVMSFTAQFCIKRKHSEEESEVMDEFLKKIILETLKLHNLDSVPNRYRCCQFITKILREMGDEVIDEDAWDVIQTAMLERLEVLVYRNCVVL